MKKNSLFLGLILIISTFSFAQTATVSLTKGQKLLVENTSNALITQQAMGQSIEIKANVTSSNALEIKDAKDTSYTLTNTITKLKMAMNFMGQSMNYDSDKKEDKDSDIGKSVGSSLNSPKDIDINKSGKVVNQKKEEKKKTEDADPMSNMMQNMMGSLDDGSAGVTLAFQPIPKNISVGYSWEDSTIKEGNRTNSTYTIKEIKGDEATVSIKSTLVMSNKVETQGMEVTSNSTGKLTGEAVVDVHTGIVKQRDSVLETTGTVEVMGQEMPMTTKVISTTKVKNI